MMAWIEANSMLAAGIALVVIGLIWLVLSRRRRPALRRDYHDVLSEGAGPAQRNSALIDAAPAAAIVPPVIAEPVVVDATGDDLTRIKGVGPKLSRLLNDLGITHYAQIAAWTEADLSAIDPQLGAFAGRPAKDGWIEQAALLCGGDTAAYEAKFGKL
ncbi:hypothetical protein [Novosphingobium sp.]|uniref:hypothetical protein n=1 Tax=Novosphingobium sp. TaxID=1874826 RepID=UPI00333EDAE3